MTQFDFDLGLLEHQLHLARQNAIQTELAAAGLQEGGHPMLMCVLRIPGGRMDRHSGIWRSCSMSRPPQWQPR